MRYRIWIRSRPGFWEPYDGKVDVLAENKNDAIERAFERLKGTFPERSRDMWEVYLIDSRG